MFYIPGATKVLPLRPGDMFFIPSAAAESSSSKESNRPGRDVLNFLVFARNENERNRKRERERHRHHKKQRVIRVFEVTKTKNVFSSFFFSNFPPLFLLTSIQTIHTLIHLLL